MTRNHKLVARFGTPLYVYDLEKVAASYRDLRNSLPSGLIIHYSLKANPHPDIARALREASRWPSCRAEVSSVGELAVALEAGYAPGDCLYTGPGKTESELVTAIAEGLRRFSVESLTDLERAGSTAVRMGTIIDCLLRINSASAKAAATSIRMMGKPSQFGIDSEDLPAQLPKLRSVPGTRLIGAHFFSLSNARDEDSLLSELKDSVITAADLQSEFDLPMQVLDIGGGFAAPYAVPGERPVYSRIRMELGATLDANFPHWRSGMPEVICESGRYLVGDCGELISSVINIKESRGNRFVIMDAGINTLGGMAGLGRLMPLAVKLDNSLAPDGSFTSADESAATLVGPLCTPGDVLGRNVQLHSTDVGDIVTVPNVGAYGVTASLLLFLSRPAPREVVVRGDEVLNVSQLRVRRAAAGDADHSPASRGRAGIT
ncbi:MAG: type III PLP-dependent enzyme [Streptosporangiaceae bacterium]|nr:type III PLP-dependent enzyme [Streptosporangiaceae bacterium]